jgi:phosphohistidine phosphatase
MMRRRYCLGIRRQTSYAVRAIPIGPSFLVTMRATPSSFHKQSSSSSVGDAVHTLYLLRHAKSSWADRTLPDRERPLAPRGRRDARRIAKHLVRLEIEPDLVVCSSAERTRETLDLIRPALGATSTLRLEDELYGASSDELLARIRLVSEECASVMLIGHNPGLQRLALVLASDGADLDRLEAKFPTAALATLTIATAWSRLAPADAALAAFVVPKQLR